MVSIKMRTAVGVGVASLLIGLTACSPSAEGESGPENATEKLSILTTQAAWSISYSPLIAAEEMGYFAEEGIEVEWLNDSSAANVATQVQQGNVDIGIVSPEPVIIGHETGDFDAVYYASMFRESIFGVAVPEDSDIQSAADLEGKRIGVTSLGASGVPIAEAVAEAAGVDPASLQFIAIGVGGQAMAALQGNEVDALSLFDTQYQTFENNGVPLRELDRGEILNLTAGGLVALPENIEAKTDLYVGAARAVAKGVLFTSLNPEATVKIFWERYPETKPAGVSDADAMQQDLSVLNKRMNSYDLNGPDERWGEFPEGSIQALIDFMLNAGLIEQPVDADAVYTDAYVDMIDGFDRAQVEEDAQNYE